jgi:hypothetical protein
MAKGFVYKKRDPAVIEKRATQSGGEFEGFISDEFKTFRPADGDNFIRILPPTWEDPEHFGIDIWAHFQVGPKNASVLCLSKMKNKKCPICEAMLKADRASDEELKKELMPRHQVAVWMVDRKNPEKGPLIYTMPWTTERDIAKVSVDKQTKEVYAIDDPEEGYDISFDRTGKGINTRYAGFQLTRKPTSIEQDWLDWVVEFPLDGCFVWRDYEEIKALFEGEDGAEAEARPADKPSPRLGSRAKATEPEEEPDADPEPEQKPKFKPRGVAAKATEPEPEPESEEEEESQEEEPEPPARPAAKKAPAKAEPEEASTSPKSRAQELREKYKNK